MYYEVQMWKAKVKTKNNVTFLQQNFKKKKNLGFFKLLIKGS